MKLEKTFRQAVDREAKLVLTGTRLKGKKEIVIEMEFLIKEIYDQHFRVPIDINHPKYWKLQRLTAESANYMQLEYSGISKKQVLAALKEFENTFAPGYKLIYANPQTERIRSLRGIRISATDRRLLAAV